MKLLKSPFIVGYSLVLVSGILLLLSHDKIPLQLQTNALHLDAMDAAMPYITWLGDGLFALALGLVFLLFVHRKLGWWLLIVYGFSAILAQIAKRAVFPDAMRPYYYLQHHPDFYAIPDFLYYEFHSFPSGHTTTAFALATVLSLHYAGKLWVQILCLFLACLVGFSRTYLSQHFLIDVVAGSLLGTLCGVALVACWPSKWTIHDKPYFKQ